MIEKTKITIHLFYKIIHTHHPAQIKYCELHYVYQDLFILRN